MFTDTGNFWHALLTRVRTTHLLAVFMVTSCAFLPTDARRRRLLPDSETCLTTRQPSRTKPMSATVPSKFSQIALGACLPRPAAASVRSSRTFDLAAPWAARALLLTQPTTFSLEPSTLASVAAAGPPLLWASAATAEAVISNDWTASRRRSAWHPSMPSLRTLAGLQCGSL